MTLTIQQEDASWRAQAKHEGIPITPARPSACGTCPWRVRFAQGATNRYFSDPLLALVQVWRGYRHSDGGARDGLLVQCHCNIHRDTPVNSQCFPELRVCTGALAVMQREAVRFFDGEPCAIDQAAAVRIAQRAGIPPDVFLSRAITRADLLAKLHPGCRDPLIGHPECRPPEPGEFDRSALRRA